MLDMEAASILRISCSCSPAGWMLRILNRSFLPQLSSSFRFPEVAGARVVQVRWPMRLPPLLRRPRRVAIADHPFAHVTRLAVGPSAVPPAVARERLDAISHPHQLVRARGDVLGAVVRAEGNRGQRARRATLRALDGHAALVPPLELDPVALAVLRRRALVRLVRLPHGVHVAPQVGQCYAVVVQVDHAVHPLLRLLGGGRAVALLLRRYGESVQQHQVAAFPQSLTRPQVHLEGVLRPPRAYQRAHHRQVGQLVRRHAGRARALEQHRRAVHVVRTAQADVHQDLHRVLVGQEPRLPPRRLCLRALAHEGEVLRREADRLVGARLRGVVVRLEQRVHVVRVGLEPRRLRLLEHLHRLLEPILLREGGEDGVE
mmetsp:Transcript_32850/g.81809  ORF Transcript_32850/g.81809 Transcript_32850/m.81809 type:complete len:374 (+) Transcript_32850:195-1316(+)